MTKLSLRRKTYLWMRSGDDFPLCFGQPILALSMFGWDVRSLDVRTISTTNLDMRNFGYFTPCPHVITYQR